MGRLEVWKSEKPRRTELLNGNEYKSRICDRRERLKSGIAGVETDDEEKKVNEMRMGWRINR
jgi:hypothetical protein